MKLYSLAVLSIGLVVAWLFELGSLYSFGVSCFRGAPKVMVFNEDRFSEGNRKNPLSELKYGSGLTLVSEQEKERLMAQYYLRKNLSFGMLVLSVFAVYLLSFFLWESRTIALVCVFTGPFVFARFRSK